MLITVKQYAEKKKISMVTAYDHLKKNKVKAKKIKGQFYVQFPDNEASTPEEPINNIFPTVEEEDAEYNQAILDKTKLENDLRLWKLKNLQADKELKDQRSKENIQGLRREFAQAFFDCFTDAFSDFKSFLIQLRLTNQQNEKFKKTFKKSVEKFRESLLKVLEKKPDNEDKKEG